MTDHICSGICRQRYKSPGRAELPDPGLPAKGMYKQAALHSVSYSVLRIVSANSPTVSWADFHLIKYGDIAVRMTLDRGQCWAT